MMHDSSGIARIVVVVGGTFAQLTRFLKSTSADVVLYLDVAKEIAGVPSASGVLRVALAAGETLATLLDGAASDAIVKFLESRPGIDLTIGLAQLRFAGKRAVARLLADAEFVRFVKQSVFDPIQIKHNGTVDKVEICVFSSLSGGTGAPAGGPIAHAIAKQFREYGSSITDIRYIRVGSLSFTGLGDLVHINAAAGLAEDVDYVTSFDRDPHEVRSLKIFELPMAGNDKDLRAQYAVEFAQALNAPGLRAILDRWAPNNAGSSKFGTISVIQAGWWDRLPATLVAHDAVRAYATDLRSVLAQAPAPAFVQAVDVDVQTAGADRVASVNELLQQLYDAGGVEPAGFFDACAAPTVSIAGVRVIATLRGTRRIDDDSKWQSLFADRPKSLADLQTRFAETGALIGKLQQEIDSRQSGLAKPRAIVATGIRQLRAIRLEFFPRSWLERVWYAVTSSPKSRAARFKTVVANTRPAANEVARIEAEIRALASVLHEITAEFRTESQRVCGVLEVLELVGQAESAAKVVDVHPIDTILEQLFTLANEPDVTSDRVVELLSTCASRVTLAGLAKITRARDATVDAIAEGIVRGTPTTVGPAWGGKRSLTPPSTIVVLPPLAQLEDKLVRRIRELAGQSEKFQLAQCETAEGGANVLRLDFRFPRTLEEIVPPFLQKNLGDALEEPDLHFDDGVAPKLHTNNEHVWERRQTTK